MCECMWWWKGGGVTKKNRLLINLISFCFFSVLPSVSAMTALQSRDYTNIDSEGSPESSVGTTATHDVSAVTHTLHSAASQSDGFIAHEQVENESSNESFPSGAASQASPCEQLIVVEEDFLNGVHRHHEESIL